MAAKQTAAFFDFDGTLISGDSQSMELRYILSRENPGPAYYLKLAGPLFTDLMARMTLVSQEALNLSYIKTYRGYTRPHLEQRGRGLFEDVLRHRFWGGSVNLLEHHRKKGHWIILVSASPDHILQPVSDFLSPHGLACTRLEFDEKGRCSGYPDDSVCIGRTKADKVRELASTLNIDLNASHAYSDHHADLAFLKAVGNPTVVNPTPRLLTLARKCHWPVHHFP